MRTVCQVIAVPCSMFFGYIGALCGYHLAAVPFGAKMDSFDVAECFICIVTVSLSVLTLRAIRTSDSGEISSLQLLFARTIGPLFAGLFGASAVSFTLADALDSIDKWPAFLGDRVHLGRIICYLLIALLSLCMSLRAIRTAYYRSSETRPLFRQSARELLLALFVLPVAATMFVDIVIYSDMGYERGPLSNHIVMDWMLLKMPVNSIVVGIASMVLAFSAVLRSRDNGVGLGLDGADADTQSSGMGGTPSSPPKRSGIEQSQNLISPTAIQT